MARKKFPKAPSGYIRGLASKGYTFSAASIKARTDGYSFISTASYAKIRKGFRKKNYTLRDFKRDWQREMQEKIDKVRKELGLPPTFPLGGYPPSSVYITAAFLINSHSSYVYFDFTPLERVSRGKDVSVKLSDSWINEQFMRGTAVYDILPVESNVSAILYFIESHIDDIEPTYIGISIRNFERLENQLIIFTKDNYDKDACARILALMKAIGEFPS